MKIYDQSRFSLSLGRMDSALMILFSTILLNFVTFSEQNFIQANCGTESNLSSLLENGDYFKFSSHKKYPSGRYGNNVKCKRSFSVRANQALDRSR